MEGGFFRAYGNVNLKKGKADVAECGEQTCLRQLCQILFCAVLFACRQADTAGCGKQNARKKKYQGVGVGLFLRELFGAQGAFPVV